MEEDHKALKIVMFPWLAMGHLIPFYHLSKLLAQKGHRLYFASTPRNLDRIPKIPPELVSKITIVPFPLPSVPNLPLHAESTMDLPYTQQQSLKKAFDLLQQPLTSFLQSVQPHWILYDYASHWLPSIASKLRINSAFFCLFNAACLSFLGVPSVLINDADSRVKPEDFTVTPKWIPFETDFRFHLHEITRYLDTSDDDDSKLSDFVRLAMAAEEGDCVIIRSSPVFEPEWFNLLEQLHKKPIIPAGFFPPLIESKTEADYENFNGVKEWLDEQEKNAVIYVALGTEAPLLETELSELAIGLEKSKVPFFWVLRDSHGAQRSVLDMLPEGFLDRVKGYGIVHVGWVPQVKILSHKSVGGFLTHCGWNSIIEGLSLGRVLVMFPIVNDQGLNARLLHGMKIAIEIPRNERDGTFTSEAVAETVRMAMVGEAGQPLRTSALKMRDLFGDQERNDKFIERLSRHLEENKLKS